MADVPQFDAARQAKNTGAIRVVPILFVPGVMGSRLRLDNDMLWDPDSKLAMLHWAAVPTDSWVGSRKDRIHVDKVGAQVMGDQGEDYDASADVFTQGIRGRGWEGVAWSFYGDFLSQFDNRLKDQLPPGFQCPVYAYGYDWRKNILISANQLQGRITEVLQKSKAEKLIVITHSMGGIVTRTALKNGAQGVLSVIHVVQPAAGAPVLYRRFFTGGTAELDGSDVPSRVLNKIMGDTGIKFAKMMSGLPGPMQLLPTDAYTPGFPWLNGTGPDGKLKTWPYATIFELYQKPDSPPGVIQQSSYTGSGLAEVKRDLMKRVTGSQSFHQALGTFKYPRTWAIYSIGVETDIATGFDSESQCVPVRINQTEFSATNIQPDGGDGTVPWRSGAALFPDELHVRNIPAQIDGTHHQFEVEGVLHADAFKISQHGEIGDILFEIVKREVSQRQSAAGGL